MGRMTRRERLTRCYFNLETDRPAVYSRAGFPAGDPTYDRLREYISEMSELKIPYLTERFEPACPADVSYEPYTEDYRRRVETLRTPSGALRKSYLESLKGQPGLQEEYFVNSAPDAERFLSLPLPEVGGDVESFQSAAAAAGDEGIVDVCLGANPGGFVAGLCGSENFAVMSVQDREIIHRLCRRRMEIMLRRLQFLLDNKIGPFFSMLGEEYIVPPLHGPADFRDFNLRYDKPIIDRIHDAGGRVHVHSHGSISKVFDDFVRMGVDVLHPFEPPPQGDILASEAKNRARGKMCLEGNIQINRMYEASPEDIRRETEQLIQDAFHDRRGLIVSPTASPYMRGRGEECFPRYRAMIETVLAAG